MFDKSISEKSDRKQPNIKSKYRVSSKQDVITQDSEIATSIIYEKSGKTFTNFTMMFEQEEIDAMKSMKVSKSAFGTFSHLALYIADRNNLCKRSVDEIARLTNSSKKTTLKEIEELESFEMIKRLAPGCYMLSPFHIMRASAERFELLKLLWNNVITYKNIDRAVQMLYSRKKQIEKERTKLVEKIKSVQGLKRDTQMLMSDATFEEKIDYDLIAETVENEMLSNRKIDNKRKKQRTEIVNIEMFNEDEIKY